MALEVEFEKGNGYKKYKAILYENGKKVKTIQFGDKRYEHYKDNVLGLYSHLDHKDPKRRKAYRTRHAGVLKKDGTPAYLDPYQSSYWSYYYLW